MQRTTGWTLVLLCVALSVTVPGLADAQDDDGVMVQNPLLAIRNALATVLDEADQPFSEDQDQQIALVMD